MIDLNVGKGRVHSHNFLRRLRSTRPRGDSYWADSRCNLKHSSDMIHRLGATAMSHAHNVRSPHLNLRPTLSERTPLPSQHITNRPLRYQTSFFLTVLPSTLLRWPIMYAYINGRPGT